MTSSKQDLSYERTVNMSLLSTIASLCSAVEFSHERLQNAVLQIVHDELTLHFNPKVAIESVRSLYESKGKVSAIRQWKVLNDSLGLKDAKDQVEDAAKQNKWRDYRMGKRCTINSSDSHCNGMVGTVDQIVDGSNGMYIRFAGHRDTIYFHQSAVTVNL
jgi:ribosomal protein L7/L12